MEQWSDPDPGSGISKQNLLIACVKKEVGSEIRCFFTPRIRDGAMVGSGSGIRDKTSRIRNTGAAFRVFLPSVVLNYQLVKWLENGKGISGA
jgi:hypothetical protein